MITNSLKRKFSICFLTLIVLLIIYYIPVKEEPKIMEETVIYDVNEVYLLNKDNLVLTSVISNSQTVVDKAKEIIDTLTINGSKKDYIDNDFKALIPSNVKVYDVSFIDNIIKINFSKEFLDISSEYEEKIIESLVYSLTNIKEVKGIMIFVETKKLDTLPHSKKKIPNILTRDYGINKIYDITSFSGVNKATLYYYTNIDDNHHLVPVTIFSNDDINKVEVIIESLKSSPIYQSNLMSFLSDNAKLLDYEIKENQVKLSFNNYLLDSFFDEELIEEVKYAISLSLKDTLGFDEVIIL